MAGDDVGDQAALAGPAGIGGLLGKRRDELEPGAVLFELPEFVEEEQVALGEGAEEVGGGPGDALFLHVAHDGPDGRHAGAAGDADDGRLRVGQVEEAVGAGEKDFRAFLEVVEDPGGADAVGHAADDEFEVVLVRRQGRNGIAAHDGLVALVVGGLELDVLAGLEGDGGRFEQLHPQLDDVVGERLLVDELGAEAGDGEQLVGDLDLEVAADLDLAGEADVVLALVGGEVRLLDGADQAAAFVDLQLAVGAGTAAAAGRGNEDVLFGEGGEQRRAALDVEDLPARIDVEMAGAVVEDLLFGQHEQAGEHEPAGEEEADRDEDGNEHGVRS